MSAVGPGLADAPWFPDLEIPAGLTAEDLVEAAALVQQWAGDEGPEGDCEWTAIPLVIRIYERLVAAAGERSQKAGEPPSDRAKA